jgi:hypothetical protein
MNELERKQGLKQESLIHFHRANLHTAFPFGKPQALTTKLSDYLTSVGRSQGLPLFSNLQKWWSNTTIVEYYKWWTIFREFLRSCLHGVLEVEWWWSEVECCWW